MQSRLLAAHTVSQVIGLVIFEENLGPNTALQDVPGHQLGLH